jgi:protein SCO1/2
MKKTLLAGVLVVSLVALGTYFASRQPVQADPGFRSGTFDPPREAPAFILDGSNGKKLSLHDYRGKVVILQFGYTFCTPVCPVTLARLNEVHKKLGTAAQEVQLIYLTVDPERDDPDRLRQHLAAFNPTFLGATGSLGEVEAVQKEYGVMSERVVSGKSASGYSMNHSTSLYLIDRQGKMRGLVPFGTPVERIQVMTDWRVDPERIGADSLESSPPSSSPLSSLP